MAGQLYMKVSMTSLPMVERRIIFDGLFTWAFRLCSSLKYFFLKRIRLSLYLYFLFSNYLFCPSWSLFWKRTVPPNVLAFLVMNPCSWALSLPVCGFCQGLTPPLTSPQLSQLSSFIQYPVSTVTFLIFLSWHKCLVWDLFFSHSLTLYFHDF